MGARRQRKKLRLSQTNGYALFIEAETKQRSEKSKKMKKKSEKAKSSAAAKTSKSGKREKKSKKMDTQRPSSFLCTLCFMHTSHVICFSA